MVQLWRSVSQVLQSQPTREGTGGVVRRSLGGPELGYLDPFVRLDELAVEEPQTALPTFPAHPHRGFEAVSYVLEGALRHQDSAGHQGELGPGGLQWLTAGRGVIHSETPVQRAGRMRGYQLWVNLPATHKMCPPRYQDIPPDAVPEVALRGGGRARVLAGRAHGVAGPVAGVPTAPLFLDIWLPRFLEHDEAIPLTHTAFLYVLEGEGAFGGDPSEAGLRASPGRLVALGPGAGVRVRTFSTPVRFLLVAARPLYEAVACEGPFVMNTREQLREAFRDFREGRLVEA